MLAKFEKDQAESKASKSHEERLRIVSYHYELDSLPKPCNIEFRNSQGDIICLFQSLKEYERLGIAFGCACRTFDLRAHHQC